MKQSYLKWGLPIVGLGLLLSACSESSPEDAVSVYIESWENREYSEMYALLSDQSREDLSEEEFVERYENSYDAHVPEFAVEVSFPEEYSGEETETIPFLVNMETVAGAYSFNGEMSVIHAKGEDREAWKIEWNPQLIFPELEDDDQISIARTKPERGEIFDAHGQGLAVNGTILRVGIVQERFEDEDSNIAEIADALDVTEDQIREQLDQGWVTESAFVPIKNMPESELTFAETLREEVPGATYDTEGGRVYPFGDRAAHLIGYIRPITGEQLEERKDQGYSSSSMLGQTGLEAAQEERLRGTEGVRLYTTSADGDEKATIAETEKEDGQDLHLTINMDIQEEIMDQLDGEPGTAVAIHPQTGETLALVSSPSYDPNLVSLGLSNDQRAELEENEDQPTLNRFYARFSPGSTMKPLTAAFGLEQGTLNPEDTIDISGKEWQPEGSDWGDYSVRRVTDPGEPVDLMRALVYSDNIYFANEALKLGEEELTEEAEAAGFHESMNYLYPFQQSLLTGEDGFSSEIQLADTGYGQGQVLVNPLHLATMYTAFVNEGAIIQPVLEQGDEIGVVWKDHISAETATLIDDALEQVVSNPSGTAHSMQIEDYSLAAKTGTAELSGAQGESGDDVLGWVVSYNRDDSDLLIAMMQERVGSGELLSKVRAIYEFAGN